LDAAEIVLYGPYWTLESGTYRLDVHFSSIRTSRDERVFLGLEVLAQNRHFLAVADYSRNDITAGRVSLDFSVPQELADNGAMIEFRVVNFGGAQFDIATMTLESLDGVAIKPRPLRWRLFTRLRPAWLLHLGLQAAPLSLPIRSGTYSITPPLKLPAGRYELSFRAERRGRSAGTPSTISLAVKMGPQTIKACPLALPPRRQSCHAIEFEVPPDFAFDHGANDMLSLIFGAVPMLSLAVSDLTLAELDVVNPQDLETGAPAIGNTSATRVVIVGNCQAAILAEGLRSLPEAHRLSVRYHFVEIAENLLDSGRAELRGSNIVLAQDIAEFASYPLRGEIPQHVEVRPFPMLRFSTPWPFDTHNGLMDREATAREQTDPMFPNLDGALARLRREIPDPEARFQAYRRLKFDAPLDPIKLARLEERRLAKMDTRHEVTIGAYILENFRKRHLFHSIGHPNGTVLSLLLEHLNRLTGLARSRPHRRNLDHLKNAQVPIHPRVAEQLGMRWASERKKYEFRGELVTWEEYTRHYIQHFG
jgi:hypothetical protein